MYIIIVLCTKQAERVCWVLGDGVRFRNDMPIDCVCIGVLAFIGGLAHRHRRGASGCDAGGERSSDRDRGSLGRSIEPIPVEPGRLEPGRFDVCSEGARIARMDQDFWTMCERKGVRRFGVWILGFASPLWSSGCPPARQQSDRVLGSIDALKDLERHLAFHKKWLYIDRRAWHF